MKEIWVAIKGYENMYEVSNLGRVRSLDRIIEMKNGRKRLQKGKQLKPTKDQAGYWKVHLSKDDKKIMVRLHRLVAEHFVNNKDNYNNVVFKDGDKNNYKFNNLEWTNDEGVAERASKALKEKYKVA